jgi:formylglycine-generating enzyme required for sulfatase activity
VTNAQYAEFLNAKAASDPYNLYDGLHMNKSSGGADFGGMTRSGSSGSYHYEVISGRGDWPVNWVSWYDAIRFANWMHNGQGNGDTETGAYTLGPVNSSGIPLDGSSITRNPEAIWFIPTASEWYKAAFHKADGPSGNYWGYATRSNTEPAQLPPSAMNANSANTNGAGGGPTNAGAYILARSAYNTFDQNGNMDEWTEALSVQFGGRLAFGGNYIFNPGLMSASNAGQSWLGEWNNIGFRLAMIPEPGTATLAGLGSLLAAIAAFWKRRGSRRTRA